MDAPRMNARKIHPPTLHTWLVCLSAEQPRQHPIDLLDLVGRDLETPRQHQHLPRDWKINHDPAPTPREGWEQ